jgi:hypothetical protein
MMKVDGGTVCVLTGIAARIEAAGPFPLIDIERYA